MRYWDINTELKFGGGLGILEGKKIKHTESWVDPLIGIKGRTPIGQSKFYLAGGLTAGGFGDTTMIDSKTARSFIYSCLIGYS